MMVLFLLILSIVVALGGLIGTKIDISGTVATKAAELAVMELSKLSDSGIYETLKLSKIISASEYEGIFHHNILLKLELSCPYYESGANVETFNVVVMRHLEDGVQSIAIDEFPLMKEDAIESFYINKVERKRKQREEAFRKLELESVFDENDENDLSFSEILQTMESEFSQDSSNSIVDKLTTEELIQDETALAKLSLKELYQVLLNEMDDQSDFKQERANKLFTEKVKTLNRR